MHAARAVYNMRRMGAPLRSRGGPIYRAAHPYLGPNPRGCGRTCPLIGCTIWPHIGADATPICSGPAHYKEAALYIGHLHALCTRSAPHVYGVPRIRGGVALYIGHACSARPLGARTGPIRGPHIPPIGGTACVYGRPAPCSTPIGGPTLPSTCMPSCYHDADDDALLPSGNF